MKIPFMCRIPIDPRLGAAGDSGTLIGESLSASEYGRAFLEAVETILRTTEPTEDSGLTNQGRNAMKIAVPLVDGKLSAHFGHCEEFALIDADRDSKEITSKQTLAAPPHEPGLLPRWLAGHGAEMIIAGGMGGRAQGLFEQQNIKVLVGAPSDTPAANVNAYLRGSLETGENVCDH